MNPKRILLVDDEDDIREVATISMQVVGGWEVRGARSGGEAIAIAIDEQPDAILLDVMMPDLDGPATFRRLQDDPRTRDIPVILLTAKAQAGDRRSFEELGVTGVLSKPFDPMLLPGEVAALLAAAPAASDRSPQLGSSAAIERIWENSRGELARRIATIEEAVAAIADGALGDDLCERARSDAHKLAGSLGMFGLAHGSGLAGELVRALGGVAADTPGYAPHLADLIGTLRAEFDARCDRGGGLAATGGGRAAGAGPALQ